MINNKHKGKYSAYRHAYYCSKERATNEIYSDDNKKGTKWTTEELEILTSNTNLSRLELSKLLGRTCISIRNQQQRLGLLQVSS